MEPAIASFKEAYGEFFEFDSVRLWTSVITFGGQEATRVDQVFKFKVKSICNCQTMTFGCMAERYVAERRFQQSTTFKFDCFPPQKKRW